MTELKARFCKLRKYRLVWILVGAIFLVASFLSITIYWSVYTQRYPCNSIRSRFLTISPIIKTLEASSADSCECFSKLYGSQEPFINTVRLCFYDKSDMVSILSTVKSYGFDINPNDEEWFAHIIEENSVVGDTFRTFSRTGYNGSVTIEYLGIEEGKYCARVIHRAHLGDAVLSSVTSE